MDDPPETPAGEEARALLRERLVAFQRRIAELSAELERRDTEATKEQEGLLLRLVEVLDGFENLDESIRKREGELDKPARRLAHGVGLLQRKLQRVLEESGVVPIELEEGLASRETCDVVETRPEPSRPDRTVLEVVRRGYRWAHGERAGRILRKAEVITVRSEG